MFGYQYNRSMSRATIEEKARGYGMIYEDESKVIFNKDVKK
ncbi:MULTISPECIES: hypothetical protein [Clostridium]|nr:MULTISPECIES: hypothetical protein [Clostridium]